MENTQYSRLVHFQQNAASVKRFRLAISALYQLGVDNILLQIGSANTPSEGTDPLTANALANAKATGFREAVTLLFSLADIETPEGSSIAPDYGALETLKAKHGLTDEEIEDFNNGEM